MGLTYNEDAEIPFACPHCSEQTAIRVGDLKAKADLACRVCGGALDGEELRRALFEEMPDILRDALGDT